MSLLRFCEWLAATPGSIALHESRYMYLIVLTVHVMTLCLFVGTAVMVEDYAVVPQSRWSFDERNPPRNDFEGLPYQLARANVLASEPRDAPRSSARSAGLMNNS